MVRKHVVKANFQANAVFIIFQLSSNLLLYMGKEKRTSKSTFWVICQGTICTPPSSGPARAFRRTLKSLANENIKVSVTLSE